jgi:hypothetical protein
MICVEKKRELTISGNNGNIVLSYINSVLFNRQQRQQRIIESATTATAYIVARINLEGRLF